MRDDVMVQLKRHLASADQIDVSRYQFINMDTVRAAAGALWPDVRSRVFLAARSIIERRVADDDLVLPCATGYLVIFKAMSGKPAADLTERIREEMERFFLGDQLIEALKVDASSEQLSIEEFTATLAEAEVAEDPTPRGAPAHRADAQVGFDEVVFAPIWDAQREAVASFLARPRRRGDLGGGWVSGAGVRDGLRKPEEHLEFDLAVLARAASALEALLKSGSRCAVLIPAHYAALSNARTRSTFVTALADLPRALQRLVWVRLEGAPLDAPEAALAETARILQAHTAHMVVHTTTEALSLARFEQIGAAAVGADFPAPLTPAARQDVDRFVALADRARCAVYFDAVDDWEAARAASRTPARQIIGSAVGDPGPLRPPFRLSRAGLLSRAA